MVTGGPRNVQSDPVPPYGTLATIEDVEAPLMAGFYVAASSKDLARYRAMVERIQAADRMYLTRDWSGDIKLAQDKGWRDSDCPLGFQRDCAERNFKAVEKAAVLIVLLPPEGVVSVGLWTELGMAVALRSQHIGSLPRIVLSTGGVRAARRQYTIFETMADYVTDSDEAAFEVAERVGFACSIGQANESNTD